MLNFDAVDRNIKAIYKQTFQPNSEKAYYPKLNQKHSLDEPHENKNQTKF